MWNNNGNRYNNWTQNNNFSGGGWGGHYGGWGSGAWWGTAAWSGVAGFLGGMAGGAIAGSFYDEPSYTSYGDSGGGGSTVYEGGDTIVVNGESEPVAEYAEEAATIADNYTQLSQEVAVPPETQQATTAAPATPPSAEVQAKVVADWMPLGIYALSEEKSTAEPTQYVQLVLSKSGALGGTFHDLTADTSTPIQGAVDPRSQRAAWKVGDTNQVMETGLYNLTQSETPVLIHSGTAQTKQMVMARIEEPGATQQAPASPQQQAAPQL
jgi:hypothetical protein